MSTRPNAVDVFFGHVYLGSNIELIDAADTRRRLTMGRLVPILAILLLVGTRPATAEMTFAGPGADYCSLVNSNATPRADRSSVL